MSDVFKEWDKEFEIETEALIRSQKYFAKQADEWYDKYYEQLLDKGDAYVKKLSRMSFGELEEEYIKKSEEVAKLPPSPVEVQKRVKKEGIIIWRQTRRITKGNYLRTQLFLIGVAIKKNNAIRLSDKANSIISKHDVNDVVDKREFDSVNNELTNAQGIIIKLRNKAKASGISREELIDIVERTKKNNGTINYSAVGREIGESNHTAKRKCEQHRIK
ncbi:MAG: hypothetical protein HYZ34_13130 [Ignavibacteriae bacterium]|nr:hypothetical protein [Ignavibacteriota bacterium]